MRVWAFMLVMTAALIGASGCEPRPNGARPGAAATGSAAGWPFWPTRLRLHPLSRITRDDATGRTMIEARVEFTDAQGVTSKAVGVISFELVDLVAPAAAAVRQVWNIDLTNLATNQLHYDVITRKYVFRLDLSIDELPAEADLRAYFVSSDGQRLDGTLRLRR